MSRPNATTSAAASGRVSPAQRRDEHDEGPFVVNRGGAREAFNLGKIDDRIYLLCTPAYGDRLRGIDRLALQQGVIPRVNSGMSTRAIDDVIVDVCRSMTHVHSDYAVLAARLLVSNLQKNIDLEFAEVYLGLHARHGDKCRLAPGFIELLRDETVARLIESRIDYRRDYDNSSFSIGTLMRSYLLRDPATGEVAELPQHMYMRVALQIHCMVAGPAAYERGIRCGPRTGSQPVADPELLNHRLESAFEVYDWLSLKRISHATPTVINAGTTIPQLSSCFQATVADDLDALYQVVHDTALMSKTGGGISVEIGDMRAAGAFIRGSGGTSSGIENYMRILQESQGYADQGGTRPGAFAVYLPVYHADVFTFLEMALPRGPRHDRRKDAYRLKYALWIPDRFFLALEQEIENERRERDGQPVSDADRAAAQWHLFSADTAPGLGDVFDERGLDHPAGPGGEFSALYDRYVREGRHRSTVAPTAIIKAACTAIGMRGIPYMLSKDNINRQSNLAVQGAPVKSSNLCAEVTIPCRYAPGDYADARFSVCNLGAVNLTRFVCDDQSSPHGVRMDFAGLIEAGGILTTNLDNIIDVNYTDVEACDRSNQHFRAIGIGIFGLADVFARFGFAFGDAAALRLDAAIHACIYFGAMHQSAKIAEYRGSFPGFAASQSAQGVLQPDMCVREGLLPADWEDTIAAATNSCVLPEMWAMLRGMVRRGLRNGYVTANMPTATSSNAATGFNAASVNECFEPYTTHLYTRKTIAGEFTMFNTHLLGLLTKRKLWSRRTAAQLERDVGSVATWDGRDGTPALSDRERRLFRTAREIDPREIIAHSVARNPFISQSQSLNHYRDSVTASDLIEIWLCGWRSGLGTLSYYIHTRPASGSMKTSAIGELSGKNASPPAADAAPACSMRSDDGTCEACAV